MLCLIDKNPKHLARKKLLNTRTVHMFGSAKNDFITTTPLRIKARLFTNVTELVMTKLYFQDMIEMITQTPLLEVLRCDIIRTRGTSGKMMLGLFSGLDRLRVLDLRFREPCEYTDHAFTISRRRVRKVLPTSLQELRLSNVYDPEEMSLLLPRDPQQPRISNDGSSSSHSTGTQQQQQQHGRDDDDDDEEEGPTATVLYRRRWMEDTLVDKYQFLHPLTNLKTLRLGRCNAYTARVWRECIKPCVGNLEYLTLVGWYNNNTETLLSASSLAPTQTKMEVDEDTQLAIQETILEVQHKMKRFVMLDFVCGPGVVGGIKKLKYVSLEASFLKQQQQQPDGIVGGTAAASDGSSNSSIGPVSYSGSLSSLTSNADELLNQHVSFCRINF
ncbi:hypothetical protein BDB00DRAFT_819493 [Zychaea mexicana]|uniref:uncharacterized protein n=1 Tax=Zychaea mexicana TaxID=64656 RepID=UPI0022FEC534|nr:uncharacterized protein BDB00DRAFT_819493 [Zychaea mexicana]KAI9494276.1 hypothetical protein BDB00DRAFT_819493 [Zychaea mexicana]